MRARLQVQVLGVRGEVGVLTLSDVASHASGRPGSKGVSREVCLSRTCNRWSGKQVKAKAALARLDFGAIALARIPIAGNARCASR
jgi:hypothetical protein